MIRKKIKLSILIWATIAVAGQCRTTIAADIVINNAPTTEEVDGLSADVIGIRSMSGDKIASQFQIGRIKFSRELIINAAMQYPDVAYRLNHNIENWSDATILDVKGAILSSGYAKENLFYGEIDDKISIVDKFPPIAKSNSPTYPSLEYWDAGFILNMLATDVLDVSKITEEMRDGKTIEFITIKDEYKNTLNTIYASLASASTARYHNISDNLETTMNIVRGYQSLEKSILRKIGDISFGLPISYSADEMGLILPQSISSQFDVYWIELSVTFKNFGADDLVELGVNFALPDDSVALELIPLNFGYQVGVEEEFNSPEIGVDIKGVEITVGEFFKRTVNYQYIKPTITAFGLRENKFSWTLKEEAVRAGSHKFAAIIGVPRGTDRTTLGMSAHMRVSEKFWVGEQLAGTDRHVVPVTFQKN